jgi:type III secretion YscU/HrpY family protein
VSNKTEKPTRKRLRDSAQKGQSFKTRDLIIACMTLCGIVGLVSFGSLVELMGAFRQVIAGGFLHDPQGYAWGVIWLGFKLLLPVLMLCVLSSALPSLLQSGFILASKALKLNFGALNPIKGVKKIFSLRTVKELVKAILYLACFVVAVIILWFRYKEQLFSQLYSSPQGMAVVWRELLLGLVLTCLACIFVVMILDAIAEYFLFMKDMKMDKQEVKREMKEQEGNPEVKGRRREVHMEILSEQVKSDVENSRVIIANPTHIAIGIYFKPELIPIPFVSVVETNQRALAVRHWAEKVGVPVISDIQLARRIYATHHRYSFINLDEVDEVLRLLVWLEQVEQAGLPAQSAPDPHVNLKDDV